MDETRYAGSDEVRLPRLAAAAWVAGILGLAAATMMLLSLFPSYISGGGRMLDDPAKLSVMLVFMVSTLFASALILVTRSRIAATGFLVGVAPAIQAHQFAEIVNFVIYPEVGGRGFWLASLGMFFLLGAAGSGAVWLFENVWFGRSGSPGGGKLAFLGAGAGVVTGVGWLMNWQEARFSWQGGEIVESCCSVASGIDPSIVATLIFVVAAVAAPSIASFARKKSLGIALLIGWVVGAGAELLGAILATAYPGDPAEWLEGVPLTEGLFVVKPEPGMFVFAAGLALLLGLVALQMLWPERGSPRKGPAVVVPAVAVVVAFLVPASLLANLAGEGEARSAGVEVPYVIVGSQDTLVVWDPLAGKGRSISLVDGLDSTIQLVDERVFYVSNRKVFALTLALGEPKEVGEGSAIFPAVEPARLWVWTFRRAGSTIRQIDSAGSETLSDIPVPAGRIPIRAVSGGLVVLDQSDLREDRALAIEAGVSADGFDPIDSVMQLDEEEELRYQIWEPSTGLIEELDVEGFVIEAGGTFISSLNQDCWEGSCEMSLHDLASGSQSLIGPRDFDFSAEFSSDHGQLAVGIYDEWGEIGIELVDLPSGKISRVPNSGILYEQSVYFTWSRAKGLLVFLGCQDYDGDALCVSVHRPGEHSVRTFEIETPTPEDFYVIASG